MKSLREILITDGTIAPARPGDPTSQAWVDLPTLRMDPRGAQAAAKTIASPPSEERAMKDLRNGVAVSRNCSIERHAPIAA